MGNRTRLPDMLAGWRTQAEAAATLGYAVRVVERWNLALAASIGALWSPTIRAAIMAGMPWLGVRAATHPARSTFAPLIATRSPLSEAWCLDCGARGAAVRRLCHESPHALPPAARQSIPLAGG
jgi:hypothetical protein